MMSIRPERPADVAVIRALTQEAFASARHASGTEHRIVDALRAAGALSISLVAETDPGALVGHVAISPVTIEGAAGWYGLGPLSVLPAQQRRGIGGALVRAALDTLRERGAAGCVLLGDPAYYGRFGFGPAAPLTLAGVPPAYFQAIDFDGARPAGAVRYHASFDVPP